MIGYLLEQALLQELSGTPRRHARHPDASWRRTTPRSRRPRNPIGPNLRLARPLEELARYPRIRHRAETGSAWRRVVAFTRAAGAYSRPMPYVSSPTVVSSSSRAAAAACRWSVDADGPPAGCRGGRRQGSRGGRAGSVRSEADRLLLLTDVDGVYRWVRRADRSRAPEAGSPPAEARSPGRERRARTRKHAPQGRGCGTLRRARRHRTHRGSGRCGRSTGWARRHSRRRLAEERSQLRRSRTSPCIRAEPSAGTSTAACGCRMPRWRAGAFERMRALAAPRVGVRLRRAFRPDGADAGPWTSRRARG